LKEEDAGFPTTTAVAALLSILYLVVQSGGFFAEGHEEGAEEVGAELLHRFDRGFVRGVTHLCKQTDAALKSGAAPALLFLWRDLKFKLNNARVFPHLFFYLS
jgi:hypothetical protein